MYVICTLFIFNRSVTKNPVPLPASEKSKNEKTDRQIRWADQNAINNSPLTSRRLLHIYVCSPPAIFLYTCPSSCTPLSSNHTRPCRPLYLQLFFLSAFNLQHCDSEAVSTNDAFKHPHDIRLLTGVSFQRLVFTCDISFYFIIPDSLHSTRFGFVSRSSSRLPLSFIFSSPRFSLSPSVR